ncbi:MAG: DUF4920 domain-containing protein [Xanthomonadales bacterium]|nr:DUF4920 domain-containing protein [Xanthomonadales bacterium]
MRLIVSAVLLTACGLADAGETTHLGKPLPEMAAVPISRAVAAFDEHAGKPQRFGGRITEVCQKKGCWIVLEDNGHTARVMFGESHDLLVPKDSHGYAEVGGVLSRHDLSPEEIEHMKADGKGLAVSPVEYRIMADGVTIERDPSA